MQGQPLQAYFLQSSNMAPTQKVKIKESSVFVKPNFEVVKKESLYIQNVQPITQEFGNGDMNVLRDKINEIIKAL